MIAEFVKSHWDGITGGGFGILMMINKTPLIDIIINTAIVTVVAAITKIIFEFIHKKISRIKWK